MEVEVWNLANDGLVSFYKLSIAPGNQSKIDNIEKISVKDLHELTYNEISAIWA